MLVVLVALFHGGQSTSCSPGNGSVTYGTGGYLKFAAIAAFVPRIPKLVHGVVVIIEEIRQKREEQPALVVAHDLKARYSPGASS